MRITFIMIAIIAEAGLAAPMPPVRPPLTSQQRTVIDSIRNSYRIEGCGVTIARGMRETACPVAAHMDTFLTWVAGVESTTTAIGALQYAAERKKTPAPAR